MIMPRFVCAVFFAIVLLTAGCAGFSEGLPPTTDARAAVIGQAVAQISAPYRYGGAERTGFDDSGLVFFAYQQAGYEIPREHDGQLRAGQPIRYAEARPGDVLFYHYDDGSDYKLHTGVYLGNGQMVHASLKRDEVVNEIIDNPFWFQRLVAVIKILP